MQIIKEVNGKGKEKITVDGIIIKEFQDINWNWEKHPAGKDGSGLTGHTASTGLGIFDYTCEGSYSCTTIWYGDYSKDFTWQQYRTGSAVEILQKIQARVVAVKAWIAECEAQARTETAEITI